MRTDRSGERGQVLVVAALMMAAMVGFLAAVVDVGNAYAQRRMMQNGADAAAVAGARLMADNLAHGVSDATVLGTINTYLSNNGTGAAVPNTGPDVSGAWYTRIDGTRVRAVGTGSLPPADATDIRGVEVQAGKQFSTFFAGVLGYDRLTVKASSAAAYGSASSELLNWTLTGVPLLPLAFDIQAYQNGINSCNGWGGFGSDHQFHFSQYIDTPSDCAVENDMHFSYSTLNIGANCSDSTIKTQFDNLINDPSSYGTTSIQVDPSGNGSQIQICHGSRMSNPEIVVGVGRTIAVPLVSHPIAVGCNPQCVAPVLGVGLVRITDETGSGPNMYYTGYWVDPKGQTPVGGLRLGTSSTITGIPTYSLIR